MFEFPVEKDKLYAAGIASGNYNTAKAQLLTVASGAIAERNIRYDKGEYSMIVRKKKLQSTVLNGFIQRITIRLLVCRLLKCNSMPHMLVLVCN